MSDKTSVKLFARWCQGEPQAADELYALYGDRLIRLVQSHLSRKMASRFDAEDVVQSACRSFFMRARDNQFTISETGELWKLLACIALRKLNGHVDRHMAGRRDVDKEDGADAVDVADKSPTPIETLALADEAEHFLAALEPKRRHVLAAWMLGATSGDIAREAGVTERRARQLRQEAIDILKQLAVANC